MVRTATGLPKGSVRLVWVVSMISQGAPAGAMQFDSNGVPVILKDAMTNYMQTKVGGTWLADLFAQRMGDKGVLSVVSLDLRSIVHCLLMRNRVCILG